MDRVMSRWTAAEWCMVLCMVLILALGMFGLALLAERIAG